MKYVLRQQKNTRTMLMRRSGVFLVSIDFELENVSWVPLQSWTLWMYLQISSPNFASNIKRI